MVGAIIQARVGSTRLPGKVLMELSGHPLIWHVINRLKQAKKVEKIILATTVNPNDDVLVEWAERNGVDCFRGSEDDVIFRFYGAAKAFNLNTIVRITADDPFKDPEIIDQVVKMFEENNLDFACNNNPPTFPEGLDVEVFSFKSLQEAMQADLSDFEREHVTQYFYHHPEKFKQGCLGNEKNISYLRWTIDTPLDWQMADLVYQHLFSKKEVFLMADILDLLERHPEISQINQKEKRSAMYN